jgi:hypothetical protein
VRPAERDVRGVIRAHRHARRDHVVALDALDDPSLVRLVTPRALLQREPVVPPGSGVPRVDAIELATAGVDQVADGVDHPVLLPLVARPLRRGEDEHRSAPMPEDEHTVAVLAVHTLKRMFRTSPS